MDSIKRNRHNISKLSGKLKAAKKRLRIAERNGSSEKQLELCRKHILGWETKLEAAKESLKLAKAEAKKEKGTAPSLVKRTLSYTGLAIALVVVTAVGASLLGKSSNGNTGEVATDSV